MKVLVLGASGFIGRPIAQALCRAGHLVYGLTRSDQKAQTLMADEIYPIVGDPTQPKTWLRYITDLDVVINVVGGRVDGQELSTLLLSAISDYITANRPAAAPKLTYIYSSGTWVHGDDRDTIVTDTTPIRNPVPLVAWRPAAEQDVIHNAVLNGVVIRPALAYGNAGLLLASLFKPAKEEGEVKWYGQPGGRLALVHTDDLASLYVLAAEKAQLVGGKIFDGANEFTESIDDILAKTVKVTGVEGPAVYIADAPTDLDRAMACTTLLRPYLARALLGWQPRKPGLVDGMNTYYAAFWASH